MKRALAIIALAAITFVVASPASARTKHYRAGTQCVDRPLRFSWWGFLTNPAPEPNGCAPPVYVNGRYVGQDSDPNIRFLLRRDPATGYTSEFYY